MSDEKQKEFEAVVRPVMKWLAENHHPHMKIVIESNCAEMVEGVMVIENYKLNISTYKQKLIDLRYESHIAGNVEYKNAINQAILIYDKLFSPSTVTDKSEAVEFAEWLSDNNWEFNLNEQWQRGTLHIEYATTQELYSIFKQSKTK